LKSHTSLENRAVMQFDPDYEGLDVILSNAKDLGY
jgi:hypothetical protein